MKTMAKLRHNKKRNTAFLYEALVREATKSILEQDQVKKTAIINIVREHFTRGSILKTELDLYKTILETKGLKSKTAEKMLSETKKEYETLDKKEIFNEQTKMINKINKQVSKEVFNNFVPNYKSLATVGQLFNNEDLPVKERVILEEVALNHMISCDKKHLQENQMDPIDNIVYTKFVDRFNSKYSYLSESQINLLSKLATSVDQEAMLQFNVFLNEEVGRIKEVLNSRLASGDHPERINEKINLVLEKLEGMKRQKLTDDSLVTILKIQELVGELQPDGD
jgi:hypothetical protein